jgi:uncharacterized membrane protein YdjX (TVP38/TMEM64 family)
VACWLAAAQASHVALLVDAGAVGVSAAVVQFQAVRKGKQVMERIKVRGVGCALMACASSVCAVLLLSVLPLSAI